MNWEQRPYRGGKGELYELKIPYNENYNPMIFGLRREPEDGCWWVELGHHGDHPYTLGTLDADVESAEAKVLAQIIIERFARNIIETVRG
jgi:hypothetical protein